MIRRAAMCRTSRAALSLGVWMVVGSGCSVTGSPMNPDDDDDTDGGPTRDDAGVDASPPGQGVTVQFAYLGADGQPVSGRDSIEFDSFAIRGMAMQLYDVELIADTVQSGQQVRDAQVLEYPWGSPPTATFPTAPPGRYSLINYQVDRTRNGEQPPPGFRNKRLSIRVVGDAFVVPETREFEYVDDKRIDFQLGFDRLVEDNETIVVELDLAAWFAGIDWQELADQDSNGGLAGGPDAGSLDAGAGEPDGGTTSGGGDGEIVIGIDGDQDAAAIMRDALRTAFRVKD